MKEIRHLLHKKTEDNLPVLIFSRMDCMGKIPNNINNKFVSNEL